jgi:hypothetical protein
MSFSYPTNAELKRIAREYEPLLTEQRIGISRVMPVERANVDTLFWEQKDNFLGLMQLRGLNAATSSVKATGSKQYVAQPGYYGENERIDEAKLTRVRQVGSFNEPASLDEHVLEATEKLMMRMYDRMEYIVWALLGAGEFSVSNSAGVIHTDKFAIQTYAPGTQWSTLATSTPLADFRAVQLLYAGKGVNLGSAATAYMNRKTSNYLLANQNANDLGGRRVSGGNTVNSIAATNQIHVEQDVPRIEIYDEGYYDDSGTFTKFIPDGKVIVVGARGAGQIIGDITLTRNANVPGIGADYHITVEELKNPREFIVHNFANFGPRLYFPGSIVAMTVA